jgi:stromal membrane-associated protein
MSRPNDKNQQILKALLRDASNSHCADCKQASHPRWASWNLGIFICIRCSGIHRSLGTHISRVKSVDLDTWTDDQVKSMVLWGNAKANQYWEEGLPQGYIPDGGKIENFIRTKYEMKKWAKGPLPDPSTLSGQPSQTIQKIEKHQQQQPVQNPQRPLNISNSSSQLLDLEFGSPIAAPVPQHSHSQPPTRLTTPSIPQLTHSQSQNNVQAKPQGVSSRPELKKSILSLYSVPIATTSAPNFSQQSFNSTGSQSTQSSNNSSLQGLNYSRPQQVPMPQVQQQWNGLSTQNEWATTTTTNSTQRGNGLDDDLFKNVWS